MHLDQSGTIGASVWSADLHTDGSNPGSAPGARDSVTADLDPAGNFAGQWIKIESLANPVPNYALQISEVRAFGLIQPRLDFTRTTAGLELTWTMGVLEGADEVSGPWSPVAGAVSPQVVLFEGLRKFYRLTCP